MAYPTPVPTPTQRPQQQPASDWNTQWNQIWNQAWNAGYNHSAYPTVPQGFGQALQSGYAAGYASNDKNPYPTTKKNSPSTGGTVMGANTVLPMNTDNGTGAAEDEARRREEETRRAIEQGYGQYQTGLQGIQSALGTSQQDELGSASKTYEQLFGGLQDQKTANLNKLQSGREAVGTRQAQSIKDLQQNLSNTLRGASMQFGAMGAGDTSATRTMLPYAYTKMAGQQEGSIRNQANDQLFQIDQQAQDTELEFSKMWRQTEIDKETQLQGIRNYYSDAIRNVQTALASAPLDKQRDLAALNQSLLSEAQANLRQLEAENRQRQESIRNWATQRVSELNNLKLQLQGTASFSPQDIVWDELSMAGINPQSNGQEAFYNPMLLASKKRSQFLGQ